MRSALQETNPICGHFGWSVHLWVWNKWTHSNYGEIIPDDWVFEEGESFSKSFMIIGITHGSWNSWRGTVPLLRVPARVKINAEYYANYNFKPIFSVLFFVCIRMKWTKCFCITIKHQTILPFWPPVIWSRWKRSWAFHICISKEGIPFKITAWRPLDFFGFGYLKQRLLKRIARTLNGILGLFESLKVRLKDFNCILKCEIII